MHLLLRNPVVLAIYDYYFFFQVDANKKYTCILCQEDDEQNDCSSTLVFTTFIVNSTVLSQVHPIDPNMTGKFVSRAILPSNLKCGPVITSCGHVMHAKCYQTMFENLVKQQQEE